MEVFKILGGLAAIGAAVAFIALDRQADARSAEVAAVAPPERTFAAHDSSARFVVPEAEPAEAAPGEAAPQD